jgi:hypothetical protein
MCHRCDEFFQCGVTFLDDLLQVRRERQNGLPSQNTMATTRMIMESLQHKTVDDGYTDVCLALAAAVERLAALDQCGLLR